MFSAIAICSVLWLFINYHYYFSFGYLIQGTNHTFATTTCEGHFVQCKRQWRGGGSANGRRPSVVTMAQRLQCKRPPAVILIVTGDGGWWGQPGPRLMQPKEPDWIFWFSRTPAVASLCKVPLVSLGNIRPNKTLSLSLEKNLCFVLKKSSQMRFCATYVMVGQNHSQGRWLGKALFLLQR